MDVRALKHSLVAAFAVAAFAVAGAMSLFAYGSTNVGETLADGTIYVGDNFAATPADAGGLYSWDAGNSFCQQLKANGHADWTLPSRHLLDQLYQHRDAGAFVYTFNDSTTRKHWYWSSKERAIDSSLAWSVRFTDGADGWGRKDVGRESVRCVRPVAP